MDGRGFSAVFDRAAIIFSGALFSVLRVSVVICSATKEDFVSKWCKVFFSGFVSVYVAHIDSNGCVLTRWNLIYLLTT